MRLAQYTLNENIRQSGIKALGFVGSVILFGIPTVLMFFSFHMGIPYLENLGLTPFKAFIVANTIPMALMFVAAMVAVIQEQSITDLPALQDALRTRMRFPRLTFKAILLGFGLYVVMLIAGGLFGLLNRLLLQTGIIPLPEYIPLLLDPRAAIGIDTLTDFVGGQLAGNWGIAVLFGMQLFFNIAGEELWWRGYILPRQEFAFGRWAWLIHGLLWWSFHMFKWWDLVTVLPIVLILSYMAQRTKNNWVPTIAHLLANSLLVLIVLAGVLGMM
jgi:membrane protease YdiL (CAAX protease family)